MVKEQAKQEISVKAGSKLLRNVESFSTDLRGIIPYKTKLFITTVVKISNPTQSISISI
jgi:hypothetical protein